VNAAHRWCVGLSMAIAVAVLTGRVGTTGPTSLEQAGPADVTDRKVGSAATADRRKVGPAVPARPSPSGRVGTRLRLPASASQATGPTSRGRDAWQRAAPGRVLALPADHGAHPGYRLEWWYYTGNLQAADGRAYGYQVTFFRVGVDPAPINPSTFAVRDLYMTHVALTDVSANRHRFADRLNRAGPQWAGAREDRYEVWNESWRVDLDGQGRHRLVADAGSFALALTLEPGKPAVLQGDRGYSRKGEDAGNASHYYSLTRMPTTGSITVDGRRVDVRGTSWMDHEFGTSALDAGTRGWDWFALQLGDGRELTLYQLRLDDGTPGPYSSGTLVERDGRSRRLGLRDFIVTPGRRWRSGASGATYPVAWDVRIPSAGLTLQVTAAVDAQELRTRRSTNVTYWEGSVRVTGQDATATGGPREIAGVGYLEMTGYSGAKMSDVMR
jgi:predicted secreted hydrolase